MMNLDGEYRQDGWYPPKCPIEIQAQMFQNASSPQARLALASSS